MHTQQTPSSTSERSPTWTGELELALHDVRLVLGDRVVDDATVVISAGCVVDVGQRCPRPPGSVDGRGRFCLPGLVDARADSLQDALRPAGAGSRRIEDALMVVERAASRAGVTTAFHGVGFATRDEPTWPRGSMPPAEALVEAIERRRCHVAAAVDHRVLHRLDVRDADALGSLAARLVTRAFDGSCPLVSYEDPTPGFGGGPDSRRLEEHLITQRAMSPGEAERYVDELLVERQGMLGNKAAAVTWLGQRAYGDLIGLACNAPTSLDEIDEAASHAVSIVEHPRTVAAARRARQVGMRTLCSATDLVGSIRHRVDTATSRIVAAGLCDGLVSGASPTALLHAVGLLVESGTVDLPTAVGLVTSGPAETVGLADRGRIEPGASGDLVLVSFDGSVPTVHLAARAASGAVQADVGVVADTVEVDPPVVLGARRAR